MALRVIQGKSASKVYSVLLLSFTLSSSLESTLGSTPQSGNLQQALCLYLAPHQAIYRLRRELIILDLVASSLGNALKGFLKGHNSHYFLINIKSSKKNTIIVCEEERSMVLILTANES